MIQDIAPHRLENAFALRREPQPGDRVLFARRGREILLRREDGAWQLPAVGETGREGLHFGFLLDGEACFLGEGEPQLPGFEWIDQRQCRELRPQELGFACITGMQLLRWRAEHRFCGACGCVTHDSLTERALVCPSCGLTVYPKIMPAVIVGIVHRGRLLVTRYADRPLSTLALVAGYTEIGETAEETVRREVQEEVGLRLGRISYYKSQPWGFSDTLLLGFFARLEGSSKAMRLDRTELKEAMWLRREELPDRRGEASLTAEMMEVFRTGKVRI